MSWLTAPGASGRAIAAAHNFARDLASLHYARPELHLVSDRDAAALERFGRITPMEVYRSGCASLADYLRPARDRPPSGYVTTEMAGRWYYHPAHYHPASYSPAYYSRAEALEAARRLEPGDPLSAIAAAEREAAQTLSIPSNSTRRKAGPNWPGLIQIPAVKSRRKSWTRGRQTISAPSASTGTQRRRTTRGAKRSRAPAQRSQRNAFSSWTMWGDCLCRRATQNR
jgi:hypothetical protein